MRSLIHPSQSLSSVLCLHASLCFLSFIQVRVSLGSALVQAALITEAAESSETMVHFYQSKRRDIPEFIIFISTQKQDYVDPASTTISTITMHHSTQRTT